MPRNFIYETAVTVDYEEGTCRVDTTVRSVASRLLACGFEEVGDRRSLPYRRFVGQADQVRFRRPKGQRALRGAAAQRVARTTAPGLRSARETTPEVVRSA